MRKWGGAGWTPEKEKEKNNMISKVLFCQSQRKERFAQSENVNLENKFSLIQFDFSTSKFYYGTHTNEFIKLLKKNFEDKRGKIIDVFVNSPKDHCIIVTFTKGAVRGNHFHKKSTQF